MTADGPVPPAAPAGNRAAAPRRELLYAVLLCLSGAGLALFTATRTWAVDVTVRPAPLPELRDPRTGGDLAPWLPGLAVVGLAGAGALLATRRLARAVVGGVLVLCAAGILGGAGYAMFNDAGGWPARPAWSALCALGGAALGAGGALIVARGRTWPAMGARYDRRTAAGAATAGAPTAAWDALDRGEDPTDD